MNINIPLPEFDGGNRIRNRIRACSAFAVKLEAQVVCLDVWHAAARRARVNR